MNNKKRKLNNTNQINIIEEVIDKVLINNDILIKKHLYTFLTDKCENCNMKIINPRQYDNDVIICDLCIHQYIFCCMDGCKMIEKYSRKKSCRYCYAWFCDKHKNKNNCCN